MKKMHAKEVSRLARNYPLSVRWSDEDQVFISSIPRLGGECCLRDTPEEVIPKFKAIAEDLVSYLTEKSQLLPEPPINSHHPASTAICAVKSLELDQVRSTDRGKRSHPE